MVHNLWKHLKENRQHGALSAGPQSVLLEGITYQDIAAGRPDSDGIVGPSDRGILIGTASKGIIDRQFQHNAQVTYNSFIHNSNDAFLCRSMDNFMPPIHSPLKPMNPFEFICRKLSRSPLPQRNLPTTNPLDRLSFMTRILKQVCRFTYLVKSVVTYAHQHSPLCVLFNIDNSYISPLTYSLTINIFRYNIVDAGSART